MAKMGVKLAAQYQDFDGVPLFHGTEQGPGLNGLQTSCASCAPSSAHFTSKGRPFSLSLRTPFSRTSERVGFGWPMHHSLKACGRPRGQTSESGSTLLRPLFCARGHWPCAAGRRSPSRPLHPGARSSTRFSAGGRPSPATIRQKSCRRISPASRRPPSSTIRRCRRPGGGSSEVALEVARRPPWRRVGDRAGVARCCSPCTGPPLRSRVLFFPQGWSATAFTLSDRLYGRDASLAALHNLLRGDATGPRLIFVEGAAGVGKTALVRELAASEGGTGGYLCQARFRQGGQTTPLDGWAAALRDLAAVILTKKDCRPRRVARPRPFRPGRHGTPDQSPSTGVERDPPLSCAVGGTGAGRYARTVGHRDYPAVAMLWLRERRVTLFFDDLQWADESSLRIPGAGADRADAANVLVLACVRPAEGDGDPAAWPSESDWARARKRCRWQRCNATTSGNSSPTACTGRYPTSIGSSTFFSKRQAQSLLLGSSFSN